MYTTQPLKKKKKFLYVHNPTFKKKRSFYMYTTRIALAVCEMFGQYYRCSVF